VQAAGGFHSANPVRGRGHDGRPRHNRPVAPDGLSTASTGTGPGVITPDGCAVDFYALVPPGPEPAIVHAAAGRRRASILELGAGTGRIADVLAGMGHEVVAVDESPEMLARIRWADRVCARIQDLELGRQFDLVLLPSFLVNAASETIRSAFLASCARHTSPSGCVLIQQHPPGWFDTVTAAEREQAGITFRLRDITRPDPGLVSATAEYQAGDRVWTHSFTAMRMGEEQLQASLRSAGLVLDRYLTDDSQWIKAVPV
jgi:2-polyprenyl-3-methyl-5-hydroxy-6-metoxy-1,4-benzoquinol methylase